MSNSFLLFGLPDDMFEVIGKRNGKSRAFAALTLHPDVPVVLVDDGVGRVQGGSHVHS